MLLGTHETRGGVTLVCHETAFQLTELTLCPNGMYSLLLHCTLRNSEYSSWWWNITTMTDYTDLLNGAVCTNNHDPTATSRTQKWHISAFLFSFLHLTDKIHFFIQYGCSTTCGESVSMQIVMPCHLYVLPQHHHQATAPSTVPRRKHACC